MPLAPTRRTAAEQRTTKEARRPQNNKLADIYIHTHTERERERESKRERSTTTIPIPIDTGIEELCRACRTCCDASRPTFDLGYELHALCGAACSFSNVLLASFVFPIRFFQMSHRCRRPTFQTANGSQQENQKCTQSRTKFNRASRRSLCQDSDDLAQGLFRLLQSWFGEVC